MSLPIFKFGEVASSGHKTTQNHLSEIWRKIVIPAYGAPFSLRSIHNAARIAAHCPSSEVRLLYLIDVPRSFVLNAPMPMEESQAQTVLADGIEEARRWDLSAATETLKVREPIEGLMKYVRQQDIDLLILGIRPDEMRGMSKAMTHEISMKSPCQVIIDYIGNA